MKLASNIAGGLLGLLFIVFSLMVLKMLLFGGGKIPQMPAGTPAALFMGAMMPTGYMTFVKICELLGGILVAIPRTRNLGLLLLGPIIVNILAFHIFLQKDSLIDPVIIAIVLLPAFLLWCERKAFAGLVVR